MRNLPRSRWGGVLIGIGLMAAVDEIIFHQLLGWHHFYDDSTPALGLLADGLLHAVEVVTLIAGFFILLDLRQHNALHRAHAWAGGFLGAGSFQVFDGIINHKILRLHQIRYEVPILPYDVAWNLVGLALIIIGLLLLRRTRRPCLTM